MKFNWKSDKWLGVIWLMLGLVALYFIIVGDLNTAIWWALGIPVSICINILVKRYGKKNIG